MNFRLAAYFILAALPTYGIRFSIFGQPTNALEILVVAILVVYFIRAKPRLGEIPADPRLKFAFAVLFFAATISLFVAPNFTAAFTEYREWYIEPLLFFWLLTREFSGVEDVKKLLIAACIPAIPISLVAIAQHFNWYPIPAGQYAIDHRSTSLYSYANAVGLYLAPLIAACAMHVILSNAKDLTQGDSSPTAQNDMRRKAFFLLTIALGLPAIFFSQTEAAWLALAAVALIYGFSQHKLRAATLGLVTAGMLVLALVPSLGEKVISKLTLQDFSGAVRRTTWEETAHFLNDHALFGAGLGGYQQMMAPYHTHTGIEIFWFPHTLLFNFWVELGLLGVIALVLLIRAVYLTTRNLPNRWLAIAPLLVMLVHGLFDVPFFKPDLALLSLFFLASMPILKKPTRV